MVLFSYLINFVEALFYTAFLAYYFGLNNKKIYVSVVTSVLFILLNFAQFIIIDNGVWLSVIICLLLVTTLIFWEKKFRFEHIYIIVLYHLFLLICSFLSVSFTKALYTVFALTDGQFYIFICVFAKIIQVLITVYLIKMEVKLIPILDLKRWNSIICIDVILLIILGTTEYAFLTNEINDFLMVFILFGGLIIAVLFRITINQISKLNRAYLNQIRKEEQNKYIEKQLLLMKSIKNEISATDHRINYLLLQLRQYLKQNRISDIDEFLEQYTKVMVKYKLACDTGNVIFDCFVSLKVNEMIMNQSLIETIFFLQKDNIYNDMNFIHMITSLLDFFKNCEKLYISMQSFGGYLDVRIIYRSGQINDEELYAFLKENFPDKNNLLNDDHLKKGVHLVINMEKYYGEYNY